MEATASAASVRPTGSRLRGATTAGWVLGGVTLGLLSTAFALDVHTSSYKQLLYVLVAAALVLLGALMTTRQPAHPISWVLAGTAFIWSVGNLA
jgi:hypothetical protein